MKKPKVRGAAILSFVFLLAASLPFTGCAEKHTRVVPWATAIQVRPHVPASAPGYNPPPTEESAPDLPWGPDRNAISRSKKENVVIHKPNVQIKNGNGSGGANGHSESTRLVNFEVAPIRIGSLKELYFMVQFQDVIVEPAFKVSRRSSTRPQNTQRDAALTAKLEQELAATKEYLQSVIETQEATNEELQSANEEILSSNEELQSTNEELETAKEELQSANEELSTVNDE